jgi:hypothetical protein
VHDIMDACPEENRKSAAGSKAKRPFAAMMSDFT